MRFVLTCLAVLSLASLGGSEDKTDPQREVLQIPEGKAPVVDGKISDEEWLDALAVKVSDACSVRLKHAKSTFYLSYTKFPGEGYACLMVNSGDHVKVLHASMKLGSATYEKKDAVWDPQAKTYSWKKADALWKDEGWKASLGSAAGQEFAVSFKTLGIKDGSEATIALAYVYGGSGGMVAQLWPAECDDSCSDTQMLLGLNPDGLRFDFSKWAVIKPGATAGKNKTDKE